MAKSDKSPKQPATPKQAILDLGIEVQRDVNGVEMGVLENGIPYLTQRGLAKITGAHRSVISDLSSEWEARYEDNILRGDRFSFLRETLARNGYNESTLYIETTRDGTKHFAYPDIVCMAVLEYYAFEAKSSNKETAKGANNDALDSYRRLAAFGLQKFIYDSLHYQPIDKWLYHHERVSILQNTSPDGYWLVFNEATGLIVDLITAGLSVNQKTIPDISIGVTWGAWWEDNDLQSRYGSRIKCDHNYPERFPQSWSNPQQVWAYPDAAIPEFRHWFKRDYLPTRYPKYILSKAKQLPGGRDEAAAIAALYQPKTIEDAG